MRGRLIGVRLNFYTDHTIFQISELFWRNFFAWFWSRLRTNYSLVANSVTRLKDH